MLDLKLLYKMLETPSISGYELEFQKMLNKELENKRKYDAIHNPKPKKIKKETKTKEVKYQEEIENNNTNKESSDLHNFYK